MAFATIADLNAVLRASIAGNDAAGLAALETATNIVEGYIGQPVELVTDDVIIFDGNGKSTFILPCWPVTDVTEIQVDGEVIEDDTYEWSFSGEVIRLQSVWPKTLRAIQVEYTHGYAVVPPVIVNVVANLAARIYAIPVAAKQESIGGYSVTYSGGGLGLQVAETFILDPYKRNIA